MRVVSIVALMLGGSAPLPAQWRLGLELSSTSYGGSSRDTSSTHVASSGRPGNATMVGLVVGRDAQRLGFALRVSYADPGLTVSGHEISVSDETVGPLLELCTTLNLRVAGIGPSGAVRAELGPALHLWDYGGEIRARAGVVTGVAYQWPISARLSGAVRLDGMLSRSWFDAGDLPPEFERRLTWRYGVTLGLRYKLEP